MRVGFFGGSFDPPHSGHLAVALAGAKAFALDRVLLAPTGQQPLKWQGAMASFADRLAMVRLLCIGHPELEASDLDAPLPFGGANFTIDTLVRVKALLQPSCSVFLLVGADAFLDLRRWRAPEELLAAADWIVVSRPGLVREQLGTLRLTPSQLERVHWLDGVAEPASATRIRLDLERGIVPDGLPGRVLEYIQTHNLYSSTVL